MKAILLYKTFSILAKTQKFMKAILLYKVFFYFFGKILDFDSPGFGKIKDVEFAKLFSNYANKKSSKSSFRKNTKAKNALNTDSQSL